MATEEKFSSVMSKPLLTKLRKEAEENGQSIRFLLERAVEHYLDVVLPSARRVRPEIMRHADATIRQYDELLKRLAKAK